MTSRDRTRKSSSFARRIDPQVIEYRRSHKIFESTSEQQPPPKKGKQNGRGSRSSHCRSSSVEVVQVSVGCDKKKILANRRLIVARSLKCRSKSVSKNLHRCRESLGGTNIHLKRVFGGGVSVLEVVRMLNSTSYRFDVI